MSAPVEWGVQTGTTGHPDTLVELESLLADAARHSASDIILVADAPPTIYTNGRWASLGRQPLTPEDISHCIEKHLTEPQRARLHKHRDIDISLSLGSDRRYRANFHYQRGSLAAAFRAIPARIPTFDELSLPPQVLGFAEYPHGLVLVTGGTGQGKSTTLAALIEHMNCTRAAHIITIEDPIEFNFKHGSCIIEQRQIGDDSPSFASALRHVLRQRPDVIMIGELRDRETISTALTAAETGHLILASLHTSTATQTLARIIDVFPAEQQPQVRTQLAASLRAILCQVLIGDRLNDALTPATEILMPNAAVRRALRDNETHLIYSMLETGRSAGMNTLEQSLADLIKSGRATTEQALAAAAEPSVLERLIGNKIPPASAVAHAPNRAPPGRSQSAV